MNTERYQRYVADNAAKAQAEMTWDEIEAVRIEVLMRSPKWQADALQEPDDYDFSAGCDRHVTTSE